MPRPLKTVLIYLLAITVPIAVGKLTVAFNLPAISPFFLWVALVARFIGFGPALAATLSASLVMWDMILPMNVFPTHVQLLRVGLFIVGAIVVSGLSRQRSKEAREADDRYRTLVELAPDGIVVTDSSGRIVFANSALAKIVGATDPSQLIGMQSTDFLPPGDHDEAKRRIDQLMAGTATPWKETRAIRLDGSVVHVERAGIPLRRGNKVFAQGFVRDLTERKEQESRLDESRRRLQALFDTALDAVLFFDSAGKFVDANPAAADLLCYTREEIVQRHVGDVIAPESRGPSLLDVVVSNGRAIGEATALRKDGQRRQVEYRCVADVIDHLHVVIARDVTERKEAEVAIRQLSGRLLRSQDEERRRIARQLHDATAQNLTAVRLNLARINRLQGSSPQLTEPLVESMALIEEVISEIRTLSYLLHPPLIEDVGLAGSLKWYARGFEARTDIKVALDVADDLHLPVEVETTLFRIIQEALTNIQRHSGGGVARISMVKTAEGIRLSIEDDGKGIPDTLRHDRDALFASGLGIAGIRERAMELGGELTIDSSDGGTRLVVTFSSNPQPSLV